MKKLLLLVVIVGLSGSIVGCGEKKPETKPAPAPAAPAPTK